MTEREEKLNFMVTYLEDNEYDDPWKAVAVLDLYKAYFDEDTPEEEIQKILKKITVDEWDDGEITFEKEDGTEKHIEYIMTIILRICSMTLDKTI